MKILKLIPILCLLAIGSTAHGHKAHEQDTDEMAEIMILEDEVESTSETQKSTTQNFKQLVSRFHPVLVHFPIAFLILAAGSEWFFLFFKRHQGRTVALVTLWIGSISAMLAAVTGWILASGKRFTGEDADLLFNHRWLGVSVVVVSALTLGAYYLIRQQRAREISYRVLITVLGALVGLTGHFGGALIYGADYLTP